MKSFGIFNDEPTANEKGGNRDRSRLRFKKRRAAAKPMTPIMTLELKQTSYRDAESIIFDLSRHELIHTWTEGFVELQTFLEQHGGGIPVEVYLNTANHGLIIFSNLVPRILSDSGRLIVARYLAACLTNHLSIFGALEILIKCTDRELTTVLKNLIRKGFLDDIGRYYRIGSVPIKILNPRETTAMEINKSKTISTCPYSRSYTVLTLNLGQTKSKISIVDVDQNGTHRVKEPLFFLPGLQELALTHTLDEFIQFLFIHCRARILSHASRIDLIGIGIAMPVLDGIPPYLPSGSNRFYFRTEHNDGWKSSLDRFATEFPDTPTFIENDGRAQAIGFAESSRMTSFLLIRFGTSLCAGIIDEHGKIVEGYHELSNIFLDLNDTTPCIEYASQSARNYLSFNGIVHISKKLGLFQKYGFRENEGIVQILEKMLNEGTDTEISDAALVYEALGRYLAAMALELKRYCTIENVVVVGSTFSPTSSKLCARKFDQTIQDAYENLNLIFAEPIQSVLGSNIGVAHQAIKKFEILRNNPNTARAVTSDEIQESWHNLFAANLALACSQDPANNLLRRRTSLAQLGIPDNDVPSLTFIK